MKTFEEFLTEDMHPATPLNRWKDADTHTEKEVDSHPDINDRQSYIRHVTPEGHDLRIFKGRRTGYVGTTNGKVTHTAEGTPAGKSKLASDMQTDAKKPKKEFIN